MRVSRQMFRHRLQPFAKSESGAAAVEFIFAFALLTVPVVNVIDLAFYAFNWMQTQNAAQMGAQAAFSNCNTANSLPATTNCAGSNSANNITFYDAVSQGIQESALNGSVTLVGSTVGDGYYCTTSADALTLVSAQGTAYSDAGTVGDSANTSDTVPTGAPATCGASYLDTNATPGEYAVVTVAHTYTSIFPWASIVSLLPATMTATAYARLN